MTRHSADKGRPKRRWLRFSLRTLLVLMTIVSLGFGWLAYKLKQAGDRRDAVTAILQQGGQVIYEYEGTPDRLNFSATPSSPAWQRNLFGFDFCESVTSVDFDTAKNCRDVIASLPPLTKLKSLNLTGAQLEDRDLVHISRLTELEQLSLSGNHITDAGLVHLQGLKKLKSLDLGGTGITDSGLRQLGSLAQLDTLELDRTHIKGSGLVHLQTLTLDSLSLGRTNVSDDALINLRSLTTLKHLSLDSTQVTNGGVISHLSQLANLASLNLGNTPISDQCLPDLRRLTHLRSLRLCNTQITDAGLVHFHGLVQLEWVDLTNTNVTDAGAKQLWTATPNALIVSGYFPGRGAGALHSPSSCD